MADLDFICTAGSRVGFGHVRRCLNVGRELAAQGIAVTIGGQLDDAATDLVGRELPGALVPQNEPASMAVIDCMFDPQDPDFYDQDFITAVARGRSATVLVTSSIQAPRDLPVDLVIGHMLDPVDQPQYALYRGLAWAPVTPEIRSRRPATREYPERLRRILVAFGNWHDPQGMLLAIDALAQASLGAAVGVLLPPVLQSLEPELRRRGEALDLDFLSNVPSVLPLLEQCDLLIGSYGNLTFEALALGVPTVVIAIKDFMLAYAGRLESQGCLVCPGAADRLAPTALARALQRLDADRRRALGVRGSSLVDGGGLGRIAALLAARLRDPGASFASREHTNPDAEVHAGRTGDRVGRPDRMEDSPLP